jgi:hypothetical protein
METADRAVDDRVTRTARDWLLRPALWFTVASIATTTLHEFAHALTAYALGIPSRLYSYSVDLHTMNIAIDRRAVIGVAGPLASLIAGAIAAIGYHRVKHPSASALPLLYLAVFGICTFFGNLMSAAFVGDFSRVAEAFAMPMPVRYACAAIGGLGLAVVQFRAGQVLAGWIPPRTSAISGVLGLVVLPVIVGTAAVILINQPLPASWIGPRIAEASFWLFSVAGALLTRRRVTPAEGTLRVHWADVAAALVAILAVRLMIRGVPFVP